MPPWQCKQRVELFLAEVGFDSAASDVAYVQRMGTGTTAPLKVYFASEQTVAAILSKV